MTGNALLDKTLDQKIANAVTALRAGGVIAYPTEYCYGLGCDPQNEQALQRLLDIKQRHASQGVILIAADVDQVNDYAELDSLPLAEQIKASWPGPNTWLLPVNKSVSSWVTGKHDTVGMRVTAHPVSRLLCQRFGGAIVSTSANRHGQDALLSAPAIEAEMGIELNTIVDAPLGGAAAASVIRHGVTGEQLR